jgi:hypothetical protein
MAQTLRAAPSGRQLFPPAFGSASRWPSCGWSRQAGSLRKRLPSCGSSAAPLGALYFHKQYSLSRRIIMTTYYDRGYRKQGIIGWRKKEKMVFPENDLYRAKVVEVYNFTLL